VRIAGSGAQKAARCSQSLRGKGDVAPRCVAAGTSGQRWPIPLISLHILWIIFHEMNSVGTGKTVSKFTGEATNIVRDFLQFYSRVADTPR
jgi:hypothetical protein